jgi:monofunctional biosynthetic peptidoglycan transglycosylase
MMRALVRLIVALLALVALAALGWLVQRGASWPDAAALAERPPETTAFIERYREQQRERGLSDSVAWRWVPMAEISPHLARAVVAAEDMEFFSHDGFSTHEIRAAAEEALEGGRIRGASTITQQLARNLWLSPSKNPARKLEEALLTGQLEERLSKRRILELYLNVVELGPGIYGAEAAAQHYFQRPAAELDAWQGALLAASLPRPTSWNPDSGGDQYLTMATMIQMRVERAEYLWRHLPDGGR